MIPALPGLVLLLAACSQAPTSGVVIEETPIVRADRARLVVEVEDDRSSQGGDRPRDVWVISEIDVVRRIGSPVAPGTGTATGTSGVVRLLGRCGQVRSDSPLGLDCTRLPDLT